MAIIFRIREIFQIALGSSRIWNSSTFWFVAKKSRIKRDLKYDKKDQAETVFDTVDLLLCLWSARRLLHFPLPTP